MEQYTDLKWGIVTDPHRVNCSWIVWEKNWACSMRCNLLFYNLPCRRTRHRELQSSDIGDYVHDRFTALDDYTKRENVFLCWRSKLSWISSVKGLWEELLQELDLLDDLLQFRTGRERRQLSELFRSATLLFCLINNSMSNSIGSIFQVYSIQGFLRELPLLSLNKAYWVQHATEGLHWKGTWIRLYP